MKKFFAIMAIAGVITACGNNNSEGSGTTDTATTVDPAITDTTGMGTGTMGTDTTGMGTGTMGADTTGTRGADTTGTGGTGSGQH